MDPVSQDAATSFSDVLQELRILLSGVQLLTGFLIVIPFNAAFAALSTPERYLYVVALLSALSSLILLSAPAALHRLDFPLRSRERFKVYATRMAVAGLAPFSLALVLTVHFTLSRAVGPLEADLGAGFVALAILGLWWLYPLWRRSR